MATLRDIRKRIQSVKNTQQITRAMYMVSTAKLRRAQENAESARAYAQTLDKVISNLAARVETREHPLIKPRQVKHAELVLFTSDRGLCGGFNANLIRKAEEFFREEKKQERYEQLSIYAVGKKGRDYFRKRKYNIRGQHLDLVRNISFEQAAKIAEDLMANYISGTLDAVYLLYPVFYSAMVQRPTVVQLLPFQPREVKEGEYLVDYIYEPGVQQLLEALLPKQIKVQIYRAMLESVASEHAARMTAMDSASSNAAEMIDKLTMDFNRARQAAITKELMEIIGGKEALEK